MSEPIQIPIPSQAAQIAKQMQVTNKVAKLQLENILLKHLVDLLDPEHDYLMDLDRMRLEKVKKDVKQLQSGTGEKTPEGGLGGAGGKTTGPATGDLRWLKTAAAEEVGGGI